MRQILFRAKTFSNQWIYGSLIQYQNSSQIGVLKYADEMNFVKVKKETIGEFTGLKDGAGNKIFEGDSICYSKHKGYILDSFVGFVVFENGSFGYIKDGCDFFIPFSTHDEIHVDFLPFVSVLSLIDKTETVVS